MKDLAREGAGRRCKARRSEKVREFVFYRFSRSTSVAFLVSFCVLCRPQTNHGTSGAGKVGGSIAFLDRSFQGFLLRFSLSEPQVGVLLHSDACFLSDLP